MHVNELQQLEVRPVVAAPTLLNSWVNFGAGFTDAGYYKDSDGVVHIQGLVKSGVIGSAIFTLPVGFRPAQTETGGCMSNGAFATYNVDTAGNVIPNVGSNNYFSLSNISFKAA